MKKFQIVLLIIGLFPVIVAGYYLSALFTPGIKNTIYTIMDKYQVVKAAPFSNYWSLYSALIILFFLLFYFVFAIVVLLGAKTRRPGEEAGSSKWEDPLRITRLLSDKSKKIDDPMNVVVYKKKKQFFLIRFFRNLFYILTSRKAD